MMMRLQVERSVARVVYEEVKSFTPIVRIRSVANDQTSSSAGFSSSLWFPYIIHRCVLVTRGYPPHNRCKHKRRNAQ